MNGGGDGTTHRGLTSAAIVKTSSCGACVCVCVRAGACQRCSEGRNPLHELAIVGHGRLASEILAQLLEKLRRQESSPGFVPTPPLNVSLLEYNVTSARQNALSRSRFSKGAEPQDDTTALGLAADRAAEQVFLRVASERSHQYRAALQAALLTPDQRLQRTPLHLAALLHGGGSLIFSTLCDAVVQSGLSLDAVLDLPDAAGKTPRQYATGAFEPFDDGDIREVGCFFFLFCVCVCVCTVESEARGSKRLMVLIFVL